MSSLGKRVLPIATACVALSYAPSDSRRRSSDETRVRKPRPERGAIVRRHCEQNEAIQPWARLRPLPAQPPRAVQSLCAAPALRWLWGVGDRPRWRRDDEGRSSCGRRQAPDARMHVDANLDLLPELAEDHDHSINSEAFEPHVADAGKFGRGDACRQLRCAHGELTVIQHLDNLGRENGARLLELGIGMAEVAEDVSTAMYQFKIIVAHRGVSFSRLMRSLIRATSAFEPLSRVGNVHCVRVRIVVHVGLVAARLAGRGYSMD